MDSDYSLRRPHPTWGQPRAAVPTFLANILWHCLARFFGMRAFVTAHVSRGNQIGVLVTREHLGVSERWRFYQFRIQFRQFSSLFVPVDVVSGQVGLAVGCPDEIDERFLTRSREDSL